MSLKKSSILDRDLSSVVSINGMNVRRIMFRQDEIHTDDDSV